MRGGTEGQRSGPLSLSGARASGRGAMTDGGRAIYDIPGSGPGGRHRDPGFPRGGPGPGGRAHGVRCGRGPAAATVTPRVWLEAATQRADGTRARPEIRGRGHRRRAVRSPRHGWDLHCP